MTTVSDFLTSAQVKEVKSLMGTGPKCKTQRELAQIYNIPSSVIYEIAKEKTWGERDKVLREIYRNYKQILEYIKATGESTIHHNGLTISFFDLSIEEYLNKLSPRKKEAFYLNVILDMKQKDVAEEMGITCVSVGQYVSQACAQLAELYFKGENVE